MLDLLNDSFLSAKPERKAAKGMDVDSDQADDSAEIRQLASEFLSVMPIMHRTRPQRQINESMRGEHFIIQYIRVQGSKVQPSQISTEMNISSARVAAALNSLEKKGFIHREIDPSDRRRILVSLTKEGKAHAEKDGKRMVEGVCRLFTELGLEDSKEIVRLMNRVAAIMEQHHTDDTDTR